MSLESSKLKSVKFTKSVILSALSLLSVNSCKSPQNEKIEIVRPALPVADYYLSPTGDDKNVGTADAPYKSFAVLKDKLKAGDVVCLRGGRYREVIDLSGLHGEANKPIRFIAAPGEEVIFDGSVQVKSDWQSDENGVFSTKIDFDTSQLFINGKSAITARWPNASFEDDSVFDMEATWRHQGKESSFGKMVDARPKGLEEGVNTESLAATGIDFTGAVAVLNINAWMSYAQKVKKHELGSDFFTYDIKTMQGNLNMLKNEKFFNHKKKLGHYYLEGLMALDTENEWYFTPEDKKLYLMPFNKTLSKDDRIRAKIQDYNLLAKNASHLSFEGIEFFATTLKFTNCTDMTVDNCHFRYPSFNKFVLGEFKKNEFMTIENSVSDQMKATNNRVLNSVFEYADGPAIKISGYKNLLENNLFHHIDFTCIGGGDGGTIEAGRGRHTIFRSNTVHTTGNSEGYRSGKQDIIENNYFHNMSLLQHDGSAINCGVNAIEDVVVRYNWVHGLRSKAAIRFDTSSMFTPYVKWGEGGTVNHNVVWDSAGLKLKGDKHKVFNNLSFDAFAPGKTDIALPCAPLMGGFNRYSSAKNNIAGAINGHFVVSKGIPLFCESEANIEGDPREVLRDPDNLDFRPKSEAHLLNKLDLVNSSELDVGPYKAGAKNYWIPGYKAIKSSMPIPVQGAKNVKTDAELMWQSARLSEAFDVYLSTNESEVEKATKSSLTYMGRQVNNIFSPKEIDPQIQYFWRIDSVVGNKVIKGDTWSFGGVETVDLYDYSKPIKRLPMADEYQLHKELESSDLKQVSKEQLLVIYQRFWWSENQKWYDALLKTKESLKEGDKNLQIIDDRLKDFLKMEGEFIQSEAKKILTRAEYERLIKYL